MTGRLFVALLAVTLLAGCTSMTGGETGDFELLVSDQPADIGDFSTLDVTFSEARIFPDNTSNETYQTIEVPNRTVDLTTVLEANASSLINASLETGTYEKIELHITEAVGMVNGSETDVMVPSGKLMLTNTFTIRPNSTTSFVFDIHVVRQGQAPTDYLLRPVISKSGVIGEDIEELDRVGGQGQAPTDGGPPADTPAR